MGDEQWPGLAGGSSGEVVPVDESDPIFDRIDPEPGPRDVEERHCGQDVESNGFVDAALPKELDGSLQDQWRAGNGVKNVAALVGVGDQMVGDLGVDLVERFSRLVYVIVHGCPAGSFGDQVS